MCIVFGRCSRPARHSHTVFATKANRKKEAGGERSEPLELEEVGEEDHLPARLEPVAGEVVTEDYQRHTGERETRDGVEARHEEAVVHDARGELPPGEVGCPAPWILEAVGVGDVGALVDHVHRSSEEEDRDEQREVDYRERNDDYRQEHGAPGVAPVAFAKVRLHKRHGVGGEQVRSADKRCYHKVYGDVRELAEVGEDVGHDQQRVREDDEHQVVAGGD